MGRKNKKIKKLCSHCGKRNKFAKNNWYGAEKTRCKYCGKILARIKEYELPVTKLESSKSIEFTSNTAKTKESLAEAIRPIITLRKIKEPRKNGWILGVIVGLVILACAYMYEERDGNTLEEVLDKSNGLNYSNLIPPKASEEFCKDIQGVPAWVQDNEIIDYGYKPNWNVSYLVKNKIFFLYSTTCPVCHKQIAEFGDKWMSYILSGYTLECW